MSNINFDNPWLLFLALPLIALFVVPYAIAVRRDNLSGHNIASGIIHILMAVIIAFVAAGTSIVTTVTETNVYVVADVSYSASRNLDTVDRYISDLGNSLPSNSKMGVVAFGKNYELLTPLGAKTQSVKNSRVDDSATDIISALRYTGELFREDVIKRIVLITDGKQTAETDSNALKRQVDALAERNIRVDAIYLDDNLRDDAREVQLSAVQVTPTTFLNGETSARITVNCSCSTALDEHGEPYSVNTFIDVKRSRTDGGDESGEPETESLLVSFTRGRNYYDLPLYTEEAGVYDYEVSIRTEKPEEDENGLNNFISFTQEVAGKQSVLIIYDDINDEEVIRQSYDATADITSFYSGSNEILTTLEWINQFDEIVLATSNVTRIGSRGNEASTNYKQFLSNLDTAVSMFGKSLITLGDTNIQNTQGELKQLSDMLPVVYSKGEGDSKLYTLLIDTSRSMEFGGRLARAKRAAIEVINMLDDKDTVYVVQFNGTTGVVQPGLVKLSEGREQLIDEINALTVHQSTNIPKALQAVVRTATSGNYSERRLMLFSDGLNFTTDEATSSVRTSILNLSTGGVVTSALDVGRAEESSQESKNAKTLLKDTIAGLGGGTYMNISTDSDLESVLKTALPADVNNSQGSISMIKVKRRTDRVLEGIDTAALQSESTLVNKFIYSRAKGAATTVLTVGFETSRTIQVGDGKPENVLAVTEVPLYSYWNYGNGKVASFTSGLSIGNNSNYWIDMSTQMRAQLLQGIMRTSVPEQKISEPFTVEIEQADGYAEVSLTPDKMSLDAVTSVEITFDDGVRTTTTAPAQLASAGSKYTYTFITGDEGKYTVKVTYKERATAEEYTVERSVHVAYSSEYDSFALYDAGTIHKMIGAQGTVSENGKLTIVNDEKDVGLYNVSLSLPLLVACVVLFAVDVAVRKLKWEDIRSFFKRHKKG